jgi:hypothetical protein
LFGRKQARVTLEDRAAMDDDDASPPPKPADNHLRDKDQRTQRLAAALRRNLKRRKAQTRGRDPSSAATTQGGSQEG